MVLSIVIQQSQLNIGHLFAHIVCSIWPIDRTLLGATTPGQSEPGSNSNEGVLRIPQISKAGASPTDGLISYPRHEEEERVLLLCRDVIGLFYSSSQLDCWPLEADRIIQGLKKCLKVRKGQ